jgi:hypothetical protein
MPCTNGLCNQSIGDGLYSIPSMQTGLDGLETGFMNASSLKLAKAFDTAPPVASNPVELRCTAPNHSKMNSNHTHKSL